MSPSAETRVHRLRREFWRWRASVHLARCLRALKRSQDAEHGAFAVVLLTQDLQSLS